MRLLLVVFLFSFQSVISQHSKIKSLDSTNTIEVVNSTFLGNEKRNFYGNALPNNLNVIWRR